jgi:hypothetical protein
MNLGIEYFIRSKFKDVPSPCSLFLTNNNNSQAFVVTLEKTDKYIVRHWDLCKCEKNSALPPVKEFEVDNVFNQRILLSNFQLLEFSEQPVLNYLNNWRNPMPKEEYDFYCHNILYPQVHKSKKKFWLWSKFMNAYKTSFPMGIRDRTSLSTRNEIPSLRMCDFQMDVVKSNYPRIWKYWKIWNKNIFKESEIAGELFFKDFYNN